MKIAIVGTLDKPIKHDSSGGTEIWTYNFVEGLIKKGHEVTLFSLKGSESTGKTVEVCSQSDITTNGVFSREKFALYNIEEAMEVLKRQNDFDLIHVSVFPFYYFLPFVKLFSKPVIFTIHGFNQFDYDGAKSMFEENKEGYYVFPSAFFLKQWPKPQNFRVIHHGINIDNFSYSNKPDDYYFWIGRICKSKGIEDAIKFAQEADEKLIIAGPIDDQDYFDQAVKPHLEENIKYVGPVNFKEKVEYYKHSKALIFTSKVNEAFGLTIIESLACGSPVIAFDRGPSSEIIIDSYNGFLIETDRGVDGFLDASKKINQLERNNCRKSIEEKFNFENMLNQYLSVYESILSK